MKVSQSFSQLQNRGSVLFIYSSKRDVFLIYHDQEANTIWKITCDKQLIITAAQELRVPELFTRYNDLHWHKPTLQDNQLLYSGMVVTEGNTYTFRISEYGVLTMKREDSALKVFGLMPIDSLSKINVEFHIQKSNRLYAVGYRKDSEQQVFVIIDIIQDKILREYVLLSGVGEVMVNTINLDQNDSRVYVGGVIIDPTTKATLQPYFESFLMLSV